MNKSKGRVSVKQNKTKKQEMPMEDQQKPVNLQETDTEQGSPIRVVSW